MSPSRASISQSGPTSSSPASSHHATHSASPVQFKFGDLVSQLPAAPLPKLTNFARSVQPAILAFQTAQPKATAQSPSSSSPRPSTTADLDLPFVPVVKKNNKRSIKKNDKRPSVTSLSTPSPATPPGTQSPTTSSPVNGVPQPDPTSPYHLVSAKIKPFRRPSKSRRIPYTTTVLLPQALQSTAANRTDSIGFLTFGSVEARPPSSGASADAPRPSSARKQKLNPAATVRAESTPSIHASSSSSSNLSSSSLPSSQHEQANFGHSSHHSSHSHYNNNNNRGPQGYQSSMHHQQHSHQQQQSQGQYGHSSHRGPHYMGSNPHHNHYGHNQRHGPSHRSGPHSFNQQSQQYGGQQQQPSGVPPQEFPMNQPPLPSNPSVVMGQPHFQGNQQNAPGMPAQPAMYIMPPQFFDSQAGMTFMYSHNIPPPQQSFAHTPSQLLQQLKQQQSSFGSMPQMHPTPGQPQMRPPQPSSAPSPGYSHSMSMAGGGMAMPPNNSTTVAGIVVPSGVDVPQTGLPQHSMSSSSTMPQSNMMNTGSNSSQPSAVGGMMAPVHIVPEAGPLMPNPSLAPAATAPPRPKVRITYKDNPNKVLTINELAKTGTVERSPSVVSSSSVPVPPDTQSDAGSALNDAASKMESVKDDADDEPDTHLEEAKSIAEKRLQENTRSGSKALPIKKPDANRISTPSPLHSPRPSPVLPVNVESSEQVEGSVNEAPKQSRSPLNIVDVESEQKSVVPDVSAPPAIVAAKSSPQSAPPVSKSPAPVAAKSSPLSGKSPVPIAAKSSPPSAPPASKSPAPVAAKLSLPSAPPATKSTAPPKDRSPSPNRNLVKQSSPVETKEPKPAVPLAQDKVDGFGAAADAEIITLSSAKARSRSPSPAPSRSPQPAESKAKQVPPPIVQPASEAILNVMGSVLKDRLVSPVCDSPQSMMVEVDTEENIMSDDIQSTTSELEEGEVRPRTENVPSDKGSDGVYRYSHERLYDLCIPSLALPPSANMHVFADFRPRSSDQGDYSARGGRGGSGGGMRPGMQSRGGYPRSGPIERNASTPTPHSASSPYGVGPGLSSTPNRLSRPVPPGVAYNAAIELASRSNSGRIEQRSSSSRGSNRDSSDMRRPLPGRRPSKRTNSVHEDGPATSSAGHKATLVNRAQGVTLLAEDLKPLEKGNEAWVPESIQAKLNHGRPMATNDDEDEEAYCARILKQTRGLLNKLTPENLERLQVKFAEQLLYPSALTTVCEAIVRKSFDEPKYASLYASLTLYMYRHIVPLLGAPDGSEGYKSVRVVTRRLIIQSCQNQFRERPKWAHLSKGSITEEQFEEVVRIKSKVIGNMRFVGELYNYQVLSNSAIERILTGLFTDLENPAEEDLECLIMLMNTCLPFLRQQKGKEFMNDLFNQIQTIVDKAELIPRIKFALDDLLSMHKPSVVKNRPNVYSPSPTSSPSYARTGSREMGPSTAQRRHNDSRERSQGGWTMNRSPAPERRNNNERSPRSEDTSSYSGDGRRSSQTGSSLRTGSLLRQSVTTHKPGVPVTANAFAALAQDDPTDEQSEEDSATPAQVQSILSRPSSGSGKKGASQPVVPESMTEEEALESMKVDMKAFLIKLNYEDLVCRFQRYPVAVVPAALGRAVEIVMDSKKTEVAAFGKALAMAVEQGLIAVDLVMQGLQSSSIFTEYEEMKCDVPLLDSFTVAMCREMSKSIDKKHLQPFLALAKSDL